MLKSRFFDLALWCVVNQGLHRVCGLVHSVVAARVYRGHALGTVGLGTLEKPEALVGLVRLVSLKHGFVKRQVAGGWVSSFLEWGWLCVWLKVGKLGPNRLRRSFH